MDTELLNQLIIPLLAFGLSFVFALGGVGAAIALVPALSWLEVPLLIAKPTELLVNTLSMTEASVSNIRAKCLDFRLGVPIIISSFLFAPLGAWSTHWVPKTMVLAVFALFLFFSGLMLIFFRAGKFENQFRDDRPILAPALIGAVAGYLSGLLGGGWRRVDRALNDHARFQSEEGCGDHCFCRVSLFAERTGRPSVADDPGSGRRFMGGVLGTRVMQAKLKPGTVKMFLGALLLLLALKMGFQLFV